MKKNLIEIINKLDENEIKSKRVLQMLTLFLLGLLEQDK